MQDTNSAYALHDIKIGVKIRGNNDYTEIGFGFYVREEKEWKITCLQTELPLIILDLRHTKKIGWKAFVEVASRTVRRNYEEHDDTREVQAKVFKTTSRKVPLLWRDRRRKAKDWKASRHDAQSSGDAL